MNSSKQPTSPLSLAYTDKTQMLVTATPLEHWSVVMVTVKHNELQQPADLPLAYTDNKTQMPVTATSQSAAGTSVKFCTVKAGSTISSAKVGRCQKRFWAPLVTRAAQQW